MRPIALSRERARPDKLVDMSSHRADSYERPLTLEEYRQLQGEGAYAAELSKGRLVREPRPGARHGRIAFELAVRLREFVREHDLGSVEMETGFRLSEHPAIVRGPDVAFIAREKLPPEVPIDWWPFAPDLAVEVISPSNTASEIEIKIFEYLDAGTRLVWVIDPESRSARIYAGNAAWIVREDEALHAGDVVPNFSVLLRSILI